MERWSDSAGGLLELIRTEQATTRAELAAITGLARSTIAQRVDTLMAAELIQEVGGAPSTGGRPATVFGFNASAGVVLVADLGATLARIGVADLSAEILECTEYAFDIADGPAVVLERVAKEFDDLLARVGRTVADVRGIGIGVPGPVDFIEGKAVNPPIMPGWHNVAIRDFFDGYAVPVLVDNDVNIMALGEYWVMGPSTDTFVFVKVGTGIGSGIILDGRLHRGARGAAGDIGHVQAGDAHEECRCGNVGCLEASASGRAVARRLRAGGYDAQNAADVVSLVRSGNQEAAAAVRDAGRLIGSVLATTVNLLNPSRIMVGGSLAAADEQLLAGIREVVYQRSTTLSTIDLAISVGQLGGRAGITGAAAMAIEHVLSPTSVDAALAAAVG